MPVHFKHLDSGKIDTTESYFSDQFLRGRINSGKESNEGYDPILVRRLKERNWTFTAIYASSLLRLAN